MSHETRLDAALAWLRDPSRNLRGGVENVDVAAGRIVADELDRAEAVVRGLRKSIPVFYNEPPEDDYDQGCRDALGMILAKLDALQAVPAPLRGLR